MAKPLSPLQVLSSVKGVVSLFWPRDKTGSGDVKTWNIYWAPRLQDTYTLVESNIANAVGFNNQFVRFDLDRAKYGIRNDQNIYLNLTATNWSGVEAAQDPLLIKIVYENGVTLANRVNYSESDIQASAAVDIDYITPDAFDGQLSYIKLTRDTTNPIEIVISLIPLGADVGTMLPDEELILDHKFNCTDRSYDFAESQYITVYDTRQVRVRTAGVSGGKLHMTMGRHRLHKFSSVTL